LKKQHNKRFIESIGQEDLLEANKLIQSMNSESDFRNLVRKYSYTARDILSEKMRKKQKEFDSLTKDSSIKKYKHLKEDFERFKKALEISQPQEMRGTFRISDLGVNVKIPIYKVKHFRSQDFKGKGSKSGFRIIYAHMNKEHKIIFIEFYHKNNKTNHDVKRIKKYFEEY